MPGHDNAPTTGTSTDLPAPKAVHHAVFRIPAANVDEFETRMCRLAAKAQRLGCGPIRWETVATEETAVVRRQHAVSPESSAVEIPLADLSADEIPDEVRLYRQIMVAGDQPRLNGWRFLGTLQHSSDPDVGTILRAVPGETIPDGYRMRGPQCDHCQTDRYRNDTYVVRHEDGRTAQVGSACLRDFVGHSGPAAIAHYAELLIEAGGLAEEAELAAARGLRHDPNGPYLPLRSYLAVVRALMRRDGWVSRSRARDEGRDGAATADVALELVLNPVLRPRIRDLEVTADDIEAVDAALDWIVEMRERSELKGYLWNLSVATGQTCLPRRSAAIAASLLVAHHGALERDRRVRAGASGNRHIGTAGVRDDFDLTVVNVRCYDSDFGFLYTIRFTDDDGNAAIWKTHTSPDDIDLQIGHRYTIRATVKEHTARHSDGQPLTLITRSRIEARHGPRDHSVPLPASSSRPATDYLDREEAALASTAPPTPVRVTARATSLGLPQPPIEERADDEAQLVLGL